MISKLLRTGSVTHTLIQNLDNNSISVFGCGLGEKLTIANESGKFILFVVPNAKDALIVSAHLTAMHYRTRVLTQDYNYDNSALGEQIVNDVMGVLSDIALEQLDALVVTPLILKLPLPDVDYIQSGIQRLSVQQNVDLDKLVRTLSLAGYHKTDLATTRGTFATRGEIIDICTLEDKCYRVVLNFDTIESIKQYNAVTMLTCDSVDSIQLTATKFLQLPNEYVEGSSIMWNLPMSTNVHSTIADYLPDALTVIDDAKACYDAFKSSVKEHNDIIKDYIASGAMDKRHKALIMDESVNFTPSVIAFQHITTSNRFFAPKQVYNIKCLPTINYSHNHLALVTDIKLHPNYTALLFANSNEGCVKLSRIFDANNISYNIATSITSAQPGTVNILAKSYPVSANFAEDNLLVVGSEQIFTKVNVSKLSKDLASYDDNLPQSGDIVVHNTHGVGKCLGVQTLTMSGNARDYVIIEYRDGDKLYLPVENMDSINKFVGADTAPKLNKLGGTEFAKQKAKVKGELKALAFDLAKLYKERMDSVGYKYPQDDEMQLQFEEQFGYPLTDDQRTAVEDIKADMTSGKIMDRLVCGDVGFGKTEVALRACFKTILAGKQVAILCPTTILSEQHYNTALVRMKNFGVNIEVLNRFKTDKQCDEILDRLSKGEIDLIVGTHKLLGGKVVFKNLGLLVLDEEQKFGVGDKEKIKNLRKNINVLTLSATPIPRTLNMALTGIRDISIIQTPPMSRLTTNVQVVEYSDHLLTSVIERELSRKGQVLVVYNKVESIYNFASRVSALLPSSVVIDVAHGQMDRKTLEDAIFRLYNGTTQVLISTTLIENGVDLPNANTLVVIDSDQLGLSQLYQLKGRIGRSDKQAYAYFTFDRSKLLGENAYKRLQAIAEFTAMGSGFKIAMRDLEIRGAGNVLGAEQSGHMQKVGYAMYVQLLNEAIAESKGTQIVPTGEVRVETSFSALIPTYYVDNYALRIRLYSKISRIASTEQLQHVLDEIEQICGTAPQEVTNLCKVALIKNYCSHLGVKRAVIRGTECYLQLADAKAVEYFTEALNNCDIAVLKGDNLPIITLSNALNPDEKMDALVTFLATTANYNEK